MPAKDFKIYWSKRESNEEVHERANMETIVKEVVDMNWARAANGQQFPPTSGHEL